MGWGSKIKKAIKKKASSVRKTVEKARDALDKERRKAEKALEQRVETVRASARRRSALIADELQATVGQIITEATNSATSAIPTFQPYIDANAAILLNLTHKATELSTDLLGDFDFYQKFTPERVETMLSDVSSVHDLLNNSRRELNEVALEIIDKGDVLMRARYDLDHRRAELQAAVDRIPWSLRVTALLPDPEWVRQDQLKSTLDYINRASDNLKRESEPLLEDLKNRLGAVLELDLQLERASDYFLFVIDAIHDGILVDNHALTVGNNALSAFRGAPLGKMRNTRGEEERILAQEWEKYFIIEHEFTDMSVIAIAWGASGASSNEIIEALGHLYDAYKYGGEMLETYREHQKSGVDMNKPFSMGTILVYHYRVVGDWTKGFRESKELKTHVGTYLYVAQDRRFNGRYTLRNDRSYLMVIEGDGSAVLGTDNHPDKATVFRFISKGSGYHAIVTADGRWRVIARSDKTVGMEAVPENWSAPEEIRRTDDKWWLNETNILEDNNGKKRLSDVKVLIFSPEADRTVVLQVVRDGGSPETVGLATRTFPDNKEESDWIWRYVDVS